MFLLLFLFSVAVLFLALALRCLRTGRVTLPYGQTALRPSIFYWISLLSYLLIGSLHLFFFFYALFKGAWR